jgi:hypothetical protein
MSFRVPPDLKERMDSAAVASGRSVAQEIELRLDKSFDLQSLLGDALELAYGREAAAIIMVLAREMVQSGRISALISSGARDAMADWLLDPYAYKQAVNAAAAVLEAFKPEGDPTALKNSVGASPDLGQINEGKRRAEVVLAAIKDPNWSDQFPEQHRNRELETFAARVRDMLGGPLTARIPDPEEKTSK